MHMSMFSAPRLSMLNFWNRLVLCNPSRLLYRVFSWDKRFVNSRSWTSEVRTILTSVDQLNCFSMNAPCDVVAAYATMSAINDADWESRRYRFPKLRYYNMYKSAFHVEDYVKCNIPKLQRSVLAQFRAGILPLEVEIGHYQNIELQHRICKIC